MIPGGKRVAERYNSFIGDSVVGGAMGAGDRYRVQGVMRPYVEAMTA